MVKIIVKDGNLEKEVHANVGETLLDTVRRIWSVFGGCSGAGVCGSCHVYISPEFMEKLGDISAEEMDVLEALHNRRPNSRLACYIKVSEDLDGMIITIPEM
jgi:2Fe-2S ferredoxin